MGPSGPSTGLPSPSKSLRPCSVESASQAGEWSLGVKVNRLPSSFQLPASEKEGVRRGPLYERGFTLLLGRHLRRGCVSTVSLTIK